MSFSPTRLASSICLLGGLCFLTGCETPTVSPLAETAYDRVGAEEYPELQYREAMKQLRLGMTKAEVTALISDPTRTTPAAADAAGLERWIYELRHRPQFRTISAEMEEIPVVDPITGEAGTIMEAREESERFQLIEVFTLGFDEDGVLADLDYTSQRQRT
jgi:outer membrane protein assembly factor BamE (lipoprotein component of BamABCDE complex)